MLGGDRCSHSARDLLPKGREVAGPPTGEGTNRCVWRLALRAACGKDSQEGEPVSLTH